MAPPVTASQLENIIQNLRAHVKDWKGHSLDTLGPLYLHEILTVRRGSQIKQFDVHIFETALIFIAEETESDSKTLHLKGRLYMKHIVKATELVSPEEMHIEISVDGMPEDQVVALIFKEENKLHVWRDLIVLLAAKAKDGSEEKEKAAGLHQQLQGRAESNVSDIPRTNRSDVESQIAEEKAQPGDVTVRYKRWGMVIMLLSCFAIQGLIVTHWFAQNAEFIEGE